MEEREKEKMPFTWNWTNELWEISEIRKGGVGVCVGVGGGWEDGSIADGETSITRDGSLEGGDKNVHVLTRWKRSW